VTVVVSEEVSEEETTNKNNTKYFTQKRVAIELQPFSMCSFGYTIKTNYKVIRFTFSSTMVNCIISNWLFTFLLLNTYWIY